MCHVVDDFTARNDKLRVAMSNGWFTFVYDRVRYVYGHPTTYYVGVRQVYGHSTTFYVGVRYV